MEVSIGIVHAGEAPHGLITFQLAEDVRCPLASKKLVPEGSLTDEDIAGLPLIHVEGLPGWEDYFELGGLARSRLTGVLDFSDSDAALAEAGLGVILASLALAEASIDRRSLVPISSRTFDTGRSWIALTNAGELENRYTASVWRWLERVAAISHSH
jgi:DNA-binding transcriptional LysR family regulator